ncbi:MAG: AAA family ATPase [Planctomycetota bacterium]
MEEEFILFREVYSKLKKALEERVIGMSAVLDQLLTGLFAGGHILLEGCPGLGKTLMVRTLCDCLELEFRRIQFTPDLMPADILGTHILIDQEHGKEFQFRKGPIFGNCVLADEINRATPKTQSALLEAMEEKTVSLARETYFLPDPFFVIATQNPIDMEGTYPLPEAQLDRFLFKIEVQIGKVEDICAIIDLNTGVQKKIIHKILSGEQFPKLIQISRKILIAPFLKEKIGNLILATHPYTPKSPESVKKYVKFGCGPRGALAIALSAKVSALKKGRVSVSLDDIREVLHPTLRHRLILNFQGEAEGITTDYLLTQLEKHYLED